MNISTIIMFCIFFSTMSIQSMEKKNTKIIPVASNKKTLYKGIAFTNQQISNPIIIRQKDTKLLHWMKKSNTYLTYLSNNNNYELSDLKNWFIPLSLTNQHLYRIANHPHFIRSVIRSISSKNDHYSEKIIAHTIGSPGARNYITLSEKLFNTRLSYPQIKHLISKGADINYRKNNYSKESSPLIYHIYQKSLPSVSHLLDLAVDINHYSSIDPLSASIETSYLPIFYVLIKHRNKTNDLYYPLCHAIQQYAKTMSDSTKQLLVKIYKTMILYLLEAGADATDGLTYAIEQQLFHHFLINSFSLYKANPNKALLKIIKYIITAKNIDPDAYTAIETLKKSPQCNKRILVDRLSTHEARIEKLKTIFN